MANTRLRRACCTPGQAGPAARRSGRQCRAVNVKCKDLTPLPPAGEDIDGEYKRDLLDSGNWDPGDPFVYNTID